MTTLEMMPVSPAWTTASKIEAEPLFDAQLRVARCADLLARGRSHTTRATDRRMWLKAELEVLGRSGRPKRSPEHDGMDGVLTQKPSRKR